MGELIVLVDENGNEIGTADKLSSHHAHTPLHKAFSCYVFDGQGKFLVTQRALSKKVWPGVWTNSVCGHPGPGEDNVSAIRRRLKEELGMTATDIQVVLPDYRYISPPFDGIIENEVCPVYIARLENVSNTNPDEVESIRWLGWQDYIQEAESDVNNTYSWWCKDQLKQLKDSKLVEKYSQPVK
jgi:isopentenyl-diphosphate Delta-isomerase